MMTLAASTTNTPPSNRSNHSCRKATARKPSSPPRASEPVSPMNTRAGCRLNRRNPSTAPIVAAAIISVWSPGGVGARPSHADQTGWSVTHAMSPRPQSAETRHPPAKPSSPSVRLTAFDDATTTRVPSRMGVSPSCTEASSGDVLSDGGGGSTGAIRKIQPVAVSARAVCARSFVRGESPLRCDRILTRSSAAPSPANPRRRNTAACRRPSSQSPRGISVKRIEAMMNNPPMVGVNCLLRCSTSRRGESERIGSRQRRLNHAIVPGPIAWTSSSATLNASKACQPAESGRDQGARAVTSLSTVSSVSPRPKLALLPETNEKVTNQDNIEHREKHGRGRLVMKAASRIDRARWADRSGTAPSPGTVPASTTVLYP